MAAASIDDSALRSQIIQMIPGVMPRDWPADSFLPNVTYRKSMHRTPVDDEDVPHHAPQLQQLFGELDVGIARYALEHPYQGKVRTVGAAAHRAALIRVGSIGVDLPQQSFYWRVAASPSIRHVCEVGFNGGHSAALWLSANPRAVLTTFDLFSDQATGFMRPNLELLQRRFPGRITAHQGNSLRTIKERSLVAPCDLVHVDGRHSYGAPLPAGKAHAPLRVCSDLAARAQNMCFGTRSTLWTRRVRRRCTSLTISAMRGTVPGPIPSWRCRLQPPRAIWSPLVCSSAWLQSTMARASSRSIGAIFRFRSRIAAPGRSGVSFATCMLRNV